MFGLFFWLRVRHDVIVGMWHTTSTQPPTLTTNYTSNLCIDDVKNSIESSKGLFGRVPRHWRRQRKRQSAATRGRHHSHQSAYRHRRPPRNFILPPKRTRTSKRTRNPLNQTNHPPFPPLLERGGGKNRVSFLRSTWPHIHTTVFLSF